MRIKIEYITDSKGRQKSVVIPHSQWKNFEADYNKMKNKVKVLTGLRSALEEVKQIQNGKSKVKTLKETLDEL